MPIEIPQRLLVQADVVVGDTTAAPNFHSARIEHQRFAEKLDSLQRTPKALTRGRSCRESHPNGGSPPKPYANRFGSGKLFLRHQKDSQIIQGSRISRLASQYVAEYFLGLCRSAGTEMLQRFVQRELAICRRQTTALHRFVG